MFVPFDADEAEAAERQVLRDGVPPSMRSAVLSWVVGTMGSRGYVYPAVLHRIENNLDVTFGLNPEFTGLLSNQQVIGFLTKLGERQLLQVADFQLSIGSTYSSHAADLERILLEGRSRYRVVQRDRAHRLEQRVPEGTRVAAEALMSSTATAGRLLATAWSKVYDLEPDDSGAYAAAVKAVEAAAFSTLGIEANANATISTAVRAIEAKGATWRLPFVREHTEAPSRDVLLGMLKSLYKGQRDRHGSAAYTDVTHDEAEAAVLLSVSLVGLFSNGLVQQRDIETYG